MAEISDLAEPRAIILIPGNHDVDVSDSLPIGKFSVPVEKEHAEARFRAFLDSVRQYVKPPDPFLSVALRVENSGERGLVALGMNSCRVERRDAQGWGYVGLDQVRTLGKTLLASRKDSAAARREM